MIYQFTSQLDMIREGEQFLSLKVGFLTFESHALFFKGNRSQRTQGTKKGYLT